MVTTFYPPYHFGGDAVFVRALARALVARGHEVEVVHCEDAFWLRGNQKTEEIADEGITVHRLKSRMSILSPLITQQTGRPGPKRKKLQAIFQRDFDVVNFHNISLIGGPAILSMSRAAVNLYTLHEHWLLCTTHVLWKNRSKSCDRPQCFRCSILSGIPPQLWRYTTLRHRNIALLDGLLAPSQYTARLHEAAGFKAPIHVLPSFSPLAPVAQFNEEQRARFVYVGRITASKGIADLVKNFSDWQEYDLWIAGDGDLRAELQQQYGKCANIRFLGRIEEEELTSLLQSSTALILPSLGPEAFPLCVIEAFACSTPAIVRDAGGAREAIDRTGAGFVYNTDAELMDILKMMVSNAAMRKRLRQLAREGYEKYYTADRYVDSYLALIESKRKAKEQLPVPVYQ